MQKCWKIDSVQIFQMGGAIGRFQKFAFLMVSSCLASKNAYNEKVCMSIQKKSVQTGPPYCTANNEDIALKFGMCVVCMKLYNIYFIFWITLKFCI